MKEKKVTRITMYLEDDEFLELGAMAFSVETWNPIVAKENAFGRLLLKLKEQIEKKVTKGQRDYLEKVVFAIQEAARSNPENIAGLKDDLREFVSDAETVMEDLK
jgi:hypothetical protein